MKNIEVKIGTRFFLPKGTECVVVGHAIRDEYNPLGNKWWAAPVDESDAPPFLICFDVDEQQAQAKTEPATV